MAFGPRIHFHIQPGLRARHFQTSCSLVSPAFGMFRPVVRWLRRRSTHSHLAEFHSSAPSPWAGHFVWPSRLVRPCAFHSLIQKGGVCHLEKTAPALGLTGSHRPIPTGTDDEPDYGFRPYGTGVPRPSPSAVRTSYAKGCEAVTQTNQREKAP